MTNKNLLSAFVTMFISQAFPQVKDAQKVFNLSDDENEAVLAFAKKEGLSIDNCIRVESIGVNTVKVQVSKGGVDEKNIKFFIDVESDELINYPELFVKAITYDIAPKEFNEIVKGKLTEKGFISDNVRALFNEMIENFDKFWSELSEDLKFDFQVEAKIRLHKGVESE